MIEHKARNWRKGENNRNGGEWKVRTRKRRTQSTITKNIILKYSTSAMQQPTGF